MTIAVKAILFDLDGTLIDSAPEIVTAANKTLAELGLAQLQPAQIEAFIGEGRKYLVQGFLTASLGHEGDDELLEKALAVFGKKFEKIQNNSRLFHDVAEALILLQSQGYRLGCVTNKPSVAARNLIRSRDLHTFFEMVMCGDSLTQRKPDAEQISYICQQLGLQPNEVLMIGDSITDVQAARAAGCYVFSVPYGYNRGLPIARHEVDGEISSLLELLDLIEPA